MRLQYELNDDDDWVREHFDELADRYEGKYVAVSSRRVVAVGNDAVDVEETALREDPSTLPSVIFLPQREDFECLL